MPLFESLEQLERNEALLRVKVTALSEDKKRAFYQLQSKHLKDPDTYAALNWLFLGGVHHYYLGKYVLFALELTLLIIAIIGFSLGYSSAIYIIILLTIYELPQLFFSQQITRQYNYNLSCNLFNEVQAPHVNRLI